MALRAWETLKLASVCVNNSSKESDRSFLSYGTTSPLAACGLYGETLEEHDAIAIAIDWGR